MQVDVTEIELAVGDMLQIGERQLTLISVESDEVTFRIDDSGSFSNGSHSRRTQAPMGQLKRQAGLTSPSC